MTAAHPASRVPTGIDGPTETTGWADARAGRWAVIGAATGFLAVTAFVIVVGWMTGMPFGSAIGFGAFVGLWGGIGFGFMMGGCIAMTLFNPDKTL